MIYRHPFRWTNDNQSTRFNKRHVMFAVGFEIWIQTARIRIPSFTNSDGIFTDGHRDLNRNFIGWPTLFRLMKCLHEFNNRYLQGKLSFNAAFLVSFWFKFARSKIQNSSYHSPVGNEAPIKKCRVLFNFWRILDSFQFQETRHFLKIHTITLGKHSNCCLLINTGRVSTFCSTQ